MIKQPVVWQSLREQLYSTYFSLLHLGQDAKLLPGQADYTRFMILGRSRTGSTLLLRSLKTHPQVVCYGELFRNDTINWQAQLGRVTHSQYQTYLANPVHFLQERVYRRQPVSIRAVGFKLFYYHAQVGSLRPVWEYVEQNKQIKILHIKRRNVLEAHLSRVVAGETDQWREGGHKAKLSTKAAAGPVTLAYAECLHVFQQTRLWEEEFDARLGDHAVLTVTYEDLARNFTHEIERVQSYLGVDQQSLQPATVKQAKKPLAERIVNYVELKQQFANTCWAEFFEA